MAAEALRDLAHAQRVGILSPAGQYSVADLEEAADELERHSPVKLTPCAERLPTLEDADLDGRVWAESGSTGTISRYSYDTLEHWQALGLNGWAPTGFTFPAELESMGPGATIDVERPQLLCKMPRELTAENGAKFLMIGEFQETLELSCLSCNPEDSDECEHCEGSGLVYVPVPVEWDTIKRIYARLVQHFAGGEPTL